MKKFKLLSIIIIILLIFIIAILFILNFITKRQKYSNFKKIAPYLYEITYNDYTKDDYLETINDQEAFGCSSVRNGNFYGRNFDYIFNEVPEFIVKVKATKTRHASIGIANHMGLRESKIDIDSYDKQLELIPNATLDGINDSGVICSINVVPLEDVEPVTGTNPNGENLHMLFIPRFVLDNASSADEAIELLKSKNIYGDLKGKYYLHAMIADENKTYIVEFINNKIVAKEKTGNEQIMTNYYNNIEYYTEHSSGIERYNILKNYYDESSTFDGMWDLLKRVRFSNVYRYDNKQEFYSEMATQSLIKNQNSNEWKNMLNQLNQIKNNYWVTIADNLRSQDNILFWHTTHNSTYDIKNRKLRITIQEDYNNYYEYYLKDVK